MTSASSSVTATSAPETDASDFIEFDGGAFAELVNIAADDLLTQLSADFPKSEVRQRQGGGGRKLDYIGIDTTINRLNSVLGAGWNLTLDDVKVDETINGDSYLAVVTVHLHALGAIRAGVGASTGADPDDTIKTALAEAIKKAGHQFGIGLYLWDEGKRDEIEGYRKLAKAPLAEIKKAVVAKAGTTDRAELAAAVGVGEGDLDNKEALLGYLAA